MKKAIKWIGACCIACVIILGIYFSIQPKTLDFRGTVNKIENTGDNTIFYISDDGTGAYVITADAQTKISYCCKDDPDIELKDICIGSVVEGNYRWLSKNKKAKFITVEYHN